MFSFDEELQIEELERRRRAEASAEKDLKRQQRLRKKLERCCSTDGDSSSNRALNTARWRATLGLWHAVESNQL